MRGILQVIRAYFTDISLPTASKGDILDTSKLFDKVIRRTYFCGGLEPQANTGMCQ